MKNQAILENGKILIYLNSTNSSSLTINAYNLIAKKLVRSQTVTFQNNSQTSIYNLEVE